MKPQAFRTRITDLFGIDHPIVCGGMMWLADAKYVSAVARAGCIGHDAPVVSDTGGFPRTAAQGA